MNFIISGKNLEVTPSLKEKIGKKLRKLEKFFNPDTEVYVTMGVEKSRQTIEVTIPFKNMFIRAEETTNDMYASIDNIIDKIERQIRKNRTRLQKRNHGQLNAEYINQLSNTDKEEGDYRIVRSKKFSMKPMEVEEAILQMNLLSHEFFVFSNSESGHINAVYKRKDGDYGLIEPEE